VDYVLMGAGIPLQIAEALDLLSQHQPAAYRLAVEGALPADTFEAHFDPRAFPLEPRARAPLKRPAFLPIISSHVLAQVLLKRSKGSIQGFVVEGPTAGGHNAPPRNRGELTASGEPLYGEGDRPDLAKIAALGLPFWLAGSYGTRDGLLKAQELGAHGIQVGTIFALSSESGFMDHLRRRAIDRALQGSLTVRTNGKCSPSGYPFKEAVLEGTLTDPCVVAGRRTICDVGCLRTLYRQEDGKIGYRCPAEPVEHFVKKGGSAEDAEGRRCLCNALTATVGAGQVRPEWGYDEPPLMTLGTDLSFLPEITCGEPYTAKDALAYLLGEPVG
jgi:NAD(P)H-dependent flavin oxidoreductase YrpB (nitropropane dioxygenase family)